MSIAGPPWLIETRSAGLNDLESSGAPLDPRETLGRVLFLVSGASGVGKSTVRELLTPRLGDAFEAVELRDLAPAEVVDVRWRQETADRAAVRAAELAADGRHLLLSGDPVAPAEAVAAPAAVGAGGVAVCLLDADPSSQRARLAARGDDPELLHLHHGFAEWMREHAHDPLPRLEVVTAQGSPGSRWGRVSRLVEEDRWTVTVIDTSGEAPVAVADAVERWMQDALSDDRLVMHPVEDTPAC